MTDLAPLRKVIFLCAAVTAAGSLTACNDPNLAKTFAEIKAIKVDDGQPGSPSDRKLSKQDLELAVNTAKDLTVNKGGLLDNSHGGLPIQVVDPLKVPPPDNGAPLDERVGDETADARAAAIHDLPDIPIATQGDSRPAPVVRAAVATPPVSPSAPAGRFVQVGSFGSAASAKSAWASLTQRYPNAGRYSPSYQSVTLASGKTMVRLKVGPVSGDDQAQALCGQLGVQDAWCSKG